MCRGIIVVQVEDKCVWAVWIQKALVKNVHYKYSFSLKHTKLVGWNKCCFFSLQWKLWSSVDFSTHSTVGLIIVLKPSEFQEMEPDPWMEWMAPEKQECDLNVLVGAWKRVASSSLKKRLSHRIRLPILIKDMHLEEWMWIEIWCGLRHVIYS